MVEQIKLSQSELGLTCSIDPSGWSQSVILTYCLELKCICSRADTGNYCSRVLWRTIGLRAEASTSIHLPGGSGSFHFAGAVDAQVWHLSKSHISIKNGCAHVWLSLQTDAQVTAESISIRRHGPFRMSRGTKDEGSRWRNNRPVCTAAMLKTTSQHRGKRSWDKMLMQGQCSVFVTLAKVVF